MTEIKIEKKKPIWPFVLFGLAIIAVLIYFLAFDNNPPEVTENDNTAELISVNENNSTVQDFVAFIEADTNTMTLDHAYTNEALLKLTEATKAMAGEVGFDISADLGKVKEHADKITNEPFADTHANHIRNAADILTNALANMQQAEYPVLNNEVSDLRNASAKINPDVLTLDQKDAVKNFFRDAAGLLKKMN